MNLFLFFFSFLSIFFFQFCSSQTLDITTCLELQNILNFPKENYQLSNDIDCTLIADFKPIGNDTVKFEGTLDGNYFKIEGFSTDGNASTTYGKKKKNFIKKIL